MFEKGWGASCNFNCDRIKKVILDIIRKVTFEQNLEESEGVSCLNAR